MAKLFENINMKPYLEASKEIGRWIIFMVLSFILTETTKQLDLVPETATIKIWVFSYVIPMRLALGVFLTFIGRWLDKTLHEIGKATDNMSLIKGITRF